MIYLDIYKLVHYKKKIFGFMNLAKFSHWQIKVGLYFMVASSGHVDWNFIKCVVYCKHNKLKKTNSLFSSGLEMLMLSQYPIRDLLICQVYVYLFDFLSLWPSWAQFPIFIMCSAIIFTIQIFFIIFEMRFASLAYG